MCVRRRRQRHPIDSDTVVAEIQPVETTQLQRSDSPFIVNEEETPVAVYDDAFPAVSSQRELVRPKRFLLLKKLLVKKAVVGGVLGAGALGVGAFALTKGFGGNRGGYGGRYTGNGASSGYTGYDSGYGGSYGGWAPSNSISWQ